MDPALLSIKDFSSPVVKVRVVHGLIFSIVISLVSVESELIVISNSLEVPMLSKLSEEKSPMLTIIEVVVSSQVTDKSVATSTVQVEARVK
ncbi:hypothetical protein QTN25_000924 [Entamoeba marina]